MQREGGPGLWASKSIQVKLLQARRLGHGLCRACSDRCSWCQLMSAAQSAKHACHMCIPKTIFCIKTGRAVGGKKAA